MSHTSTYQSLDPRAIVIHRDSRQRQENIAEVEDLKQSIATIGILNPIIVRQTADGPTLVAGERRLKASLELDLAEVPIRFFEDLPAEEAEIVELEENVKRRELSWRDQVKAVGRIHHLLKTRTVSWKVEQTADYLSVSRVTIHKYLTVYDNLDSGRLGTATSIEQAYNTLQRFVERKAETIVGDIIAKSSQMFGNISSPAPNLLNEANTTITTVEAVQVRDETVAPEDMPFDAPAAPAPIPSPPPAYVPPADPIINAEFGSWISAYNGPKFNLIHCDFPYGNYKGNDSQGSLGALETEDFYDNTESVYWNLVNILTQNLDKIMSYSAHMMFWFNMNFYTETVRRFRACGLTVHDHPLIWHKTGGPGGLGVAPGTEATHPRRTYDTCLIAVRGNRPLVRSMCNSYAAPTAGNKIHPSQKPEPMLRYFMQMFVDEQTTVFDPTCGSAAALRAAEDLKAKYILGLEMDPNYAATANTRTLQARVLRAAGQLRRDVA